MRAQPRSRARSKDASTSARPRPEAARLGVHEQVLEAAVLRAGPDGEAVAEAADAHGRVAGEQVIGVRVRQEPPHARLEDGVAGLVAVPPVAEGDHEPGDVLGVVGCGKANHPHKYSHRPWRSLKSPPASRA
jgi:hypothetical protein